MRTVDDGARLSCHTKMGLSDCQTPAQKIQNLSPFQIWFCLPIGEKKWHFSLYCYHSVHIMEVSSDFWDVLPGTKGRTESRSPSSLDRVKPNFPFSFFFFLHTSAQIHVFVLLHSVWLVFCAFVENRYLFFLLFSLWKIRGFTVMF